MLALVIAVLSLLPSQEFPETDVPFADKWVHWVMYAALAAVVIWEDRESLIVSSHHMPAVVILCSMYGGLMEVLQATVTTTRSGDWLDFYADALGVVISSLLFYIYRFIWK